ncbi:hypothetical protein BOTBODRAFT_112088 [Botryobasidium botryosum FD-172 SS1]|uniref:C2H2-type domain-containing protein n=1 Tax=Botryobasidium botryosum (strain FD-172 SS1) TaxID=930990 RepID=A0A067MBW6_BOTB1|nr:hypothetical protein BOTBODRAFT_112088 [Botryobasidium botryosum FD-172 SS1]
MASPALSTKSSYSLASSSAIYHPAPAHPIKDDYHHLNTWAASTSYPCRWSGCSQIFSSTNELVTHVNLAHLRSAPNHSFMAASSVDGDPSPLSCLWDDCHAHPTLQSSSLGAPFTDPDLAALAAHLIHDHLGLENLDLALDITKTPSGVANRAPAPAFFKDFSPILPSFSKPPHDPETPSSSDVPTPSSASSSTTSQATHKCGWEACTEAFADSEALTNHITSVHVGSGQAHYHCYWTDCERNGKKSFASRQKILRHIQSHTGHRPFHCTQCEQCFSEAATLQQHLRRHSQEKPYACDYPGCGKAFAITGALTIHKRIHNGEKPFKCTYCDRAFSETSNLSKHLRTHTGVRPYLCKEPGCGKRFARPDQLNRHLNSKTHRGKVHLKNASGGGNGE